MAYSYKQTMDSDGYGDGGYINFNVSPALNSILGVGDVLTISGQAYWKTVAIKSTRREIFSIFPTIFIFTIQKSSPCFLRRNFTKEIFPRRAF